MLKYDWLRDDDYGIVLEALIVPITVTGDKKY